MNRVVIDETALRHNLERLRELLASHGASFTVVTKSLCGHADAIGALRDLGVTSMADSRLPNLETLGRVTGDVTRWYLRPPHHSELGRVVSACDISLNSELCTLRLLDAEARRQGRRHGVVIMVELGDLREGLLPGSLVDVYAQAIKLRNIDVVGIGANLGCLSGVVPSQEQLMQLAMYHELLELKFGRPIPLVSAGTSAVLPLLMEGGLPPAITHFRVGESLFLGTDLVHGGTLDGFRDDAVVVEAEIIEIKEKSLVAQGEVSDVAPFEATGGEASLSPGSRGFRALVDIGQVDTDVGGLVPLDPGHQVAGASSDITVVNVGSETGGLRVGDWLRFGVGYSAFVRLMSSSYNRCLLQRADGQDRVLPPDLTIPARPTPAAGDPTTLSRP